MGSTPARSTARIAQQVAFTGCKGDVSLPNAKQTAPEVLDGASLNPSPVFGCSNQTWRSTAGVRPTLGPLRQKKIHPGNMIRVGEWGSLVTRLLRLMRCCSNGSGLRGVTPCIGAFYSSSPCEVSGAEKKRAKTRYPVPQTNELDPEMSHNRNMDPVVYPCKRHQKGVCCSGLSKSMAFTC